MAARIIQACDAVVTLVKAAWSPSDPDGIERVYAPPINLSEDCPPVHVGRRLYVFPGPYERNQIDRDTQMRNYVLRLLMVERYTDANDPDNAWLDERVDFFEDQFNRLANESLKVIGEMTPDPDTPATVDILYDQNVLIQHKAFWAQATFPFIEPTDLAGVPPS